MARLTLQTLFLLTFSTQGIQASLPNGENPFFYGLKQLKSIPDHEGILREELPVLMGEDAAKKVVADIAGIGDVVDDGGAACDACESVMTSLADLTRTVTWADMRDPVVDLCMALLRVLDGLGGSLEVEVICNGTIDLQGPHVYYVLEATTESDDNPTTRDVCENLNLCYPPESRGVPPLKSAKLSHTHHHYPARDTVTPLKIAQLTDIHMDQHYSVNSSTHDCGYFFCCRDSYNEGTGSASQWGDYNCNTPQATIDLFLEYVADLGPDFVVYSGDSPPHHIWEETYGSQLSCTEKLVESMTDKLGHLNVFPAIGNHEMFPTNLYYMKLNCTVDMNIAFADLWKGLAGFEEEQIDTMEKGGYYTLDLSPGDPSLRILTVNTNYWYTANFYNTLNDWETDDITNMTNWVKEELEEAKNAGDKVIVIGHHPPGEGSAIVKHTRLFTDTIVHYNETVVLHMAGHTHKDHYKVVRDSNGDPSYVVNIAPSVDPHGTVNPSVRLWYLDPTTFQVLDYEQFHMDLESVAGKLRSEVKEPPAIISSYNATTEYHMADMSAQSWMDLTQRFQEDNDLFQTYYQHYYSQTDRGHCDTECKDGHLCSNMHSNYDEVQQCQNPVSDPPTTVDTPPEENTEGDGTGRSGNTRAGMAVVMVACMLLLAF